jgi:hypothetical protein
MKYYVLKYKLDSDDPLEGEILWETEADSLTAAMKLVKVEKNCEYEVVSETDILEQLNKYHDVETLLH